MAAVSASTLSSSVGAAAPSASLKSEFAGVQVHGVPALVTKLPSRSLKIEAKGGKVVSTKEPLGPSGGTKFRNGIDAGGRKAKGKGVYQFTKKYGANVDGYSPIWDPNEWSSSGDKYAAGSSGLALWALTLGGVLLGGLLLVYNTSALAQ